MAELVDEIVIPAIRQLAKSGVLPRDLVDWPLAGELAIDSLGIDSLGKLNLLSELEERADVVLSERHLVGLSTLHDLGRLLSDQMAEQMAELKRR